MKRMILTEDDLKIVILGYPEDDLKNWLWSRAAEWTAFPSFVLQPIIPILLILVSPFYVLFGLAILNILWCKIRYSYLNILLSYYAVLFVAYLKWPAAIGSFFYLIIYKQYLLSVLALSWPLISGFIAIPGKIGIIEMIIAARIGFVDLDKKLHETIDKDAIDRTEIWLTTEGAAEFLGMTTSKVRDYARHGVLPASKEGRGWRFNKHDLVLWLSNKEYYSIEAMEEDNKAGVNYVDYEIFTLEFGGCRLDQDIKDYKGELEDISSDIYYPGAIEKVFSDEKVYDSDPIVFLDINWRRLLAVTDHKIYKIALWGPQGSAAAYDKAREFFYNMYGRPVKTKGWLRETMSIWEIPFGNPEMNLVIYQESVSDTLSITATSRKAFRDLIKT